MNRVVIVTGGSGGLGSAAAKAFAADGDKVVVNYNRSREDAERVVQEIKKKKGTAIACKADVANYGEVKAMVDETVEKWGRIDIVVNNAGGLLTTAYHDVVGVSASAKGCPIVNMSEEEWNWHINSNLTGAFHLIKAAAPYMMKQNDGHIFNIVSSHAWTGRPGRAAYSAAKAGMLGLTKSAAAELGEYNVKVNSVMPGVVRVPRMGPVQHAGAEQRGVLGKWANPTPEEFADSLVFLSKTKNVSGQLFNFDNLIGL